MKGRARLLVQSKRQKREHQKQTAESKQEEPFANLLSQRAVPAPPVHSSRPRSISAPKVGRPWYHRPSRGKTDDHPAFDAAGLRCGARQRGGMAVGRAGPAADADGGISQF